jgi:hypothetical protein
VGIAEGFHLIQFGSMGGDQGPPRPGAPAVSAPAERGALREQPPEAEGEAELGLGSQMD